MLSALTLFAEKQKGVQTKPLSLTQQVRKLDKITLLNEDCIEVMKRYPDGYFSLAIVDPPYGIGIDKAINANKGKKGYKMYKNTDWDSATPTPEYWEQLFRVSKNQIVWGGNYMTEFLPPSMGWIIWNKMQRDFTMADGELAWTSFDKAIRIFDMSRGAALAKNNEMGGRFHPTQKPVDLYKWTLKNYAKPDMKILDTHGGSMSIALALHDFGIQEAVICEIDPDYYQSGKARFEQHKRQLNLFAA